MIQVIYVAGPYRAQSTWQIECNIHEATKIGHQIAALGAIPLIPHRNTGHFDGLQTEEFWLEATLELMRRCDAVFAMPTWQRSQGASNEVETAQKINIPVFFTFPSLSQWIADQ